MTTKKLVIPKFIDDYLKKQKKKSNLIQAMSVTAQTNPNVFLWLQRPGNGERFAAAWLNPNYEVDRTRWFVVNIPINHPSKKQLVLTRHLDGSIYAELYNDDVDVYSKDIFHLTDKEIKKEFLWAMPFARELFK